MPKASSAGKLSTPPGLPKPRFRKQIATLGTSGALEPVPFPVAHSVIPLGHLESRISVSIHTLETGKWCE